MVVVANLTPKRRLISNVTNAVGAEVTTTAAHGYSTGYVVRVIVPEAYGMSLYNQATIEVTSDTTFITDLDTSTLDPFVAPVFVPDGQAFTEAQTVPISGTTDNVAR